MKRFDIKNPGEWQPLQVGEVLAFDTRRNRLTLNCSGPTKVFVSNSEDMANPVLLGAGSGVLVFTWSADQTAYVEAVAETGHVVYINGHSPGRVAPPSDEPAFVNIAPRGRPTELQRMMYSMQQNQKVRDEQLRREFQRVQERQAAPLVEPAPTTATEPAPVTEPAPTSTEAST